MLSNLCILIDFDLTLDLFLKIAITEVISEILKINNIYSLYFLNIFFTIQKRCAVFDVV